MGAGKLPNPGGEVRGTKHQRDDGEVENETPAELTVAELVCELLYAGKTRAEIAGYDDVFMRWVLCRQRDEQGKLVRVPDGLPSWVVKHLDSNGHWNIRDPQPFGAMFRQVKRQQGLSEEEQQRSWEMWKQENPNYGEGGGHG